MSNLNQRLIIVTGKGGVGKTTVSSDITFALKNRERKAIVYNFEHNKNNVVPSFTLDPQYCIQNYLETKFYSKKIAHWVTNKSFFISTFNMVEELKYIIILGQIFDDLNKDPNLTIVLDSPSSGHFLSMVYSLDIFGSIFQKGIIFQDINKIKEKLYDSDLTKAFIVTLPSVLSISEAKELKEETPFNTEFVLSSCISVRDDVKNNINSIQSDLLKRKISIESKAINNQLFAYQLPYLILKEKETMVSDLAKQFS